LVVILQIYDTLATTVLALARLGNKDEGFLGETQIH
jgi:hypothetical protein